MLHLGLCLLNVTLRMAEHGSNGGWQQRSRIFWRHAPLCHAKVLGDVVRQVLWLLRVQVLGRKQTADGKILRAVLGGKSASSGPTENSIENGLLAGSALPSR